MMTSTYGDRVGVACTGLDVCLTIVLPCAVNLNRAIDLYIASSRGGRTPTQRTYQRHLFAFADFIREVARRRPQRRRRSSIGGAARRL